MISRAPRAAIATVLAEGLLGRLTFGMVSFAFPLYALSLGLSFAEIGLLISLRTVLAMSLKPAAGWLTDHVGVRRVYLAGAFARVLAALALLVAGGVVGLAVTRLLQGASAAGRDVASLGVIARDSGGRVGTVYGWYATAKHVGSVGGAALAGLAIGWTGGYGALFVLIAVLSLLPLTAAWYGLREDAPDPDSRDGSAPDDRPADDPSPAASRSIGIVALVRELAGPMTVGTLVATAAYMVHGMFPILAVQHAGLSEAQAGIVYSLSAAVFLVAGPSFGWLVDRFGPTVGLAWRSVANVGSSLLYIWSPTFVGLAAARSIDDSGKAAFRPAWASTIAAIAAADPPRRGRRLGVLDTSEDIGEAIGPALAGLLWQSGGIAVLFGVRIAIALAAEVMTLRVLGSAHTRRAASRSQESAARSA